MTDEASCHTLCAMSSPVRTDALARVASQPSIVNEECHPLNWTEKADRMGCQEVNRGLSEARVFRRLDRRFTGHCRSTEALRL